MTNRYDDEKFGSVVREYVRGRISRRQFIVRGAQLGLSAAALAKLTQPSRAAANLIESDPASPFESPITSERVAFLKTKPYKGTTINVMVLKATVGDGLKYHVPHWEEATGGKVNVAEVPIETLHTQIFSDLSSGLGKYDAYMTGAWFYGDFFVPKEPYIVPVEKFISDPKHSYWEPDQWIPAMRKLYSWNEKVYGVLFDGDAQALYYRKDIFGKKEIQDKFKAKYNYDLPAPPKTTKEYHDVADFFTGWDWNGDGQNDWGISLHAKVNEQGFFHFLTLSAPFVVSPDNKYYFFNPDTMKPLINSEGHVRALEDYVKFLANGPKEEIAWTLGQGWNLFLDGHSATEPTWGDLPTLAQDPKTSKVQGKMGAAPAARHDGGVQSDHRPVEEVRPQPGRQHQRRLVALRDLASVEEAGGDVRLPRLHGEQEERLVQLHDRVDRRAARDEVRVHPAHGIGQNQRLDGRQSAVERRRRRRVPQGLLRGPGRAHSARIPAHSGSGRVLARARHQRFRGARRPDRSRRRRSTPPRRPGKRSPSGTVATSRRRCTRRRSRKGNGGPAPAIRAGPVGWREFRGRSGWRRRESNASSTEATSSTRCFSPP